MTLHNATRCLEGAVVDLWLTLCRQSSTEEVKGIAGHRPSRASCRPVEKGEHTGPVRLLRQTPFLRRGSTLLQRDKLHCRVGNREEQAREGATPEALR
jgi:hypothetical protein